MIIIYFIIDYIVMFLLPIKTCLIVWNIENNKVFDVFVVGIIIDVFYRKFLLFTSFLLILYFVFWKIKIKNKYKLLKNIIVYIMMLVLLNII